MISFFDRTPAERETIDNAYEFERVCILTDCTDPNPYMPLVKAMVDGDLVWDAINEALEMAFN